MKGIKFLSIAFLIFATSCASHGKKVSDSPTPQGTDAGEEVSGPSETPSEVEVESDVSEPKTAPKKAVLVLGPGMARGFAYAGVLKALHKAGIEVGAIYGVEFGALIAAFYGFSKTQNEFEWNLSRLKPAFFEPSGFSLGRLFGAGKSNLDQLDGLINSISKKKELQQSRVPIAIGVKVGREGNSPATFKLLTRGGTLASVRGAIAQPPLYAEYVVNKQKVTSAGELRPFLIAEAKALGLGPVIAVDVIEDSDDEIKEDEREIRYLNIVQEINRAAEDELKEADLVLRPQVKSVGFLDFSQKNVALFEGQKVVEQQIDEIKELLSVD